jgi:hypothetical protein
LTIGDEQDAVNLMCQKGHRKAESCLTREHYLFVKLPGQGHGGLFSDTKTCSAQHRKKVQSKAAGELALLPPRELDII